MTLWSSYWSPNYWVGRPHGRPIWLIIHDMEVVESNTTAENVAKNVFGKSPGYSAHWCSDADSNVHCVDSGNRAWHCGTHGNDRGIGFEQAGYARQSRAEWLDPFSLATMQNTALAVAQEAKRWSIPPIKITASDAQRGVAGILGHRDIAAAFPLDTNHSDPGTNFPYDVFIPMVQQAMDPTSQEEVVTPENIHAIAVEVARLICSDPDPAVKGSGPRFPVNIRNADGTTRQVGLATAVQVLADRSTPVQIAQRPHGLFGSGNV